MGENTHETSSQRAENTRWRYAALEAGTSAILRLLFPVGIALDRAERRLIDLRWTARLKKDPNYDPEIPF